VWERNAPVTPCSTADWWIQFESGLKNGVFNTATNFETFVNYNVPNNGNISECTFVGEMSNYLPQTVPNLYVMQANNLLCNYPGNYLNFPYPFGQRINTNDMVNIGNGSRNLWSLKNFQLANNTTGVEIFNGHKLNYIWNSTIPGYLYYGRRVDGNNINITDCKFWR
jgi:hypothetical protein